MSAECASRGLTALQSRALSLLLAGNSARTVASKCGAPERTLLGWMRQPEFRDALTGARAQLLQETWSQLAAAASEAIRTLVEVSQDSEQKGSVRVAAAAKLLALLFRHAPQVSTPLASAQPEPDSPQIPTAFVEALERVYGRQDETRSVPASPASAALPIPPGPETSVHPRTGQPSFPPGSDPRRDPPAAVGPQAPDRLTVLSRGASAPFRDLANPDPTPERALTLKVPDHPARPRSPIVSRSP